MTEDHRLIKSAKSARDGNVSEASIPDDVMSAARKIIDAMPARTPWKHEVEEAIANAILAERESSAKIAQEVIEEFGDTITTNGLVRRVLSAIRRR